MPAQRPTNSHLDSLPDPPFRPRSDQRFDPRLQRRAPRRPPRSARRAATRQRSRVLHRRVVTALLCIALVVFGLALLRGGLQASPSQGAEAAWVPNVLTSVDPAPTAASAQTTRAGSSATPPPARPVLRLPGAFPPEGRGTFTFHANAGKVLGTSGELRRFRVAVEDGVPEDLGQFAATLDATLGDRRSWSAGGRLRMQRVGQGTPHDFTIYLASGQTARRLCATGGVDIRVGGEPYTSCRASGKVILNLNRWRLSVPQFVDGNVPLAVYRQYVINHEVGHELGHGHEACPRRGGPAPVMQTQTLGLGGCVANAWPYVNGRRFTGPPTT